MLIAALANIGSFVARKLVFAVIMQTKYSFYADYFYRIFQFGIFNVRF